MATRRGRAAALHESFADLARTDSDFMRVAVLYAGDDTFDVGQVVAELVGPESVPCLPALRYTDDGLRKRASWDTLGIFSGNRT